MATETRLGPGGRILLVVAGGFVIFLGADRAGWLPEGAPHLFPPRVVVEPPPLPVPPEPAPAPPPGFVFAPTPPAACMPSPSILRVATVRRLAAARLLVEEPGRPAVTLSFVESGAAALHRLRADGAELALLPLSEAAIGLREPDAALYVAAVVASGRGELVLEAGPDVSEVAALAGRIVAVGPGAAERLVLAAVLERAGMQQTVTTLQEPSTEAAVKAFSDGRASAAVAPSWAFAALNRDGRAGVLRTVEPLDPMVLVGRGKVGCLPDGLTAALACPLPQALQEATLAVDDPLSRGLGVPALSAREALQTVELRPLSFELAAAWATLGEGMPPLAQVVDPRLFSARCPSPASAAPIGGMGELKIDSTPSGAVVEIDGVLHGVTPFRLAVPAGRRKVTVKANGKSRSLGVEIKAGVAQSLKVEL